MIICLVTTINHANLATEVWGFGRVDRPKEKDEILSS